MKSIACKALAWFCLSCTIVVLNATADQSTQAAPHFLDMRDALHAVKSAPNPKEQMRILTHLDNYPVTSAEGVKDLYLSSQEAEKEFSSDNEGETAFEKAKLINRALAKCTDSQFHPTLKALLETEERSLPSAPYLGAYGKVGLNETYKATFKQQRLEALTKAAGDGRDRDALPALRRMAGRDDVAGQLAMTALAKIGDPADLDYMVQRAKVDRNAPVDFEPYGAAGLARLLSEIRAQGSGSIMQVNLRGHIQQFDTRDCLPMYQQLLQEKDPVIVRMAADAIVKIADKGDEPLIESMLKSPNAEVRFAALKGIDQKLWSNTAAVQVMQVLKTDPADVNRAHAAHILGVRRVGAAKAALSAALNDSSAWVKSAAVGALKLLQGK